MHGVPGKCRGPLSGIRAEAVTERPTGPLGPVLMPNFSQRQGSWDTEILETNETAA